MPSTPVRWQELLAARIRHTPEQYGPNTATIWSAVKALGDTPWFEHVGEPWMEPAPLPATQIVVVKSWDEALSIFTDFPKYNINGVLQAACDPIDEIVASGSSREELWQRVRHDFSEHVSVGAGIPDSLSQEHKDLMFEHVWEYVSMLFAEIIAEPDEKSTYFREQLTWFHAGHFPCGWDGNWPTGRMRVY